MGRNYKHRSCTCACDGLKLTSPGGKLKKNLISHLNRLKSSLKLVFKVFGLVPGKGLIANHKFPFKLTAHGWWYGISGQMTITENVDITRQQDMHKDKVLRLVKYFQRHKKKKMKEGDRYEAAQRDDKKFQCWITE